MSATQITPILPCDKSLDISLYYSIQFVELNIFNELQYLYSWNHLANIKVDDES